MKNVVSSLCVAAAFLTAGEARADYLTSYTVTLNPGLPRVTNILILEQAPDFSSMTWPFSADGDGATTELDNPFPQSSLINRSLLIGLVKGLPGDANPEQKHVVLFMDDMAAILSANIAWGTLFRTTLEDQLIANIELATSGLPFDVIQPALDAIGVYANGDAETGILDPDGVSQSAWLATGGTFTVMTWSDGGIIGQGTSQITSAGAGPVLATGAADACTSGANACTPVYRVFTSRSTLRRSTK